MRDFRESRIVDVVAPLITFVVLFAMWEAVVRTLHVPVFYVPAPSAIMVAMYRGLDQYMLNLWVTVYSTMIAFGIAFVLGIALGALVSEIRMLERTMLPVMVALQSMPRIALAPLLIVWFGFGVASKIVLGAFTAFFPVFLNTLHGMRTADPDQIALMRSVRASRLQIFWKIRLPNALPFLLAGAQIGVVFAMLAVIVGEFLGANRGMGFLIATQSAQMDSAGVLAGVFILSAVGVLFHQSLQLLRRHLFSWSAVTEIAGSPM